MFHCFSFCPLQTVKGQISLICLILSSAHFHAESLHFSEIYPHRMNFLMYLISFLHFNVLAIYFDTFWLFPHLQDMIFMTYFWQLHYIRTYFRGTECVQFYYCLSPFYNVCKNGYPHWFNNWIMPFLKVAETLFFTNKLWYQKVWWRRPSCAWSYQDMLWQFYCIFKFTLPRINIHNLMFEVVYLDFFSSYFEVHLAENPSDSQSKTLQFELNLYWLFREQTCHLCHRILQ